MPDSNHAHRTELRKMDDAIQRIKARRRKSVLDSLQSKRTFVDTLRDKQEWIVEELAFRNPSNVDSDKKWCYWAQCRLAEINSELILYTE